MVKLIPRKSLCKWKSLKYPAKPFPLQVLSWSRAWSPPPGRTPFLVQATILPWPPISLKDLMYGATTSTHPAPWTACTAPSVRGESSCSTSSSWRSFYQFRRWECEEWTHKGSYTQAEEAGHPREEPYPLLLPPQPLLSFEKGFHCWQSYCWLKKTFLPFFCSCCSSRWTSPFPCTCTSTCIPLSAAAEQGDNPPPVALATGLYPLVLFAAAHQGGHPPPLATLSEPVVINSPGELTIDDSVGYEYEQPYYKTPLNQDQRSRL